MTAPAPSCQISCSLQPPLILSIALPPTNAVLDSAEAGARSPAQNNTSRFCGIEESRVDYCQRHPKVTTASHKMADPFSIVAGAMGVAEICFRIVLSVKGLRRELSSIAQELEHLASDVEELSTVCHLIKDTFNSSSLAASSSTRGARTAASTEALWEHLGKNINHCHALARKLKLVVEDICGDPGRKGPPLLNQYNQAARKKSRGEELRRYRAQIDMFQNSLHLMLTFIILCGPLEPSRAAWCSPLTNLRPYQQRHEGIS